MKYNTLKYRFLVFGLVFSFFVLFTGSLLARHLDTKNNSKTYKKVIGYLNKYIEKEIIVNKKILDPYNILSSRLIKLDTLIIDELSKTLHIYFNKKLAEIPFRNESVSFLYSNLKKYIKGRIKGYSTKIYANRVLIENLVPQFYSKNNHDRENNLYKNKRCVVNQLVKRRRAYNISGGLEGKNIALWNSHGWYFEQKLDRWEWERARLFTTVEDVLPTSFVVPYIIPMLENAGAFVITPRERDIQSHELIVDNDDTTSVFIPSYFTKSETGTGYGNIDQLKERENPFRQGTFSYGIAQSKDSIIYIPDFKVAGKYMVYVSYGNLQKATKINYRVYHNGGYTDYEVNQEMGMGTWIPLGFHTFNTGMDKTTGSVVIYIESGQQVSTDAVRFGGGIGNVSRNGQLSGRSRFFEAARYYLQYAGFPDTLVWYLNDGKNDYKDDYQSRGEWVNYLIGNSFSKNNDSVRGINIPIDLSFAFHTDAGVLGADSTVGTLAIYSTDKNNGFFEDSLNRYVSRDMSDLIQTQIVKDISARFDTKWNRRGIWNSQYSEAYRPNTPSMLLELLSHQNFTDMKFALDPNFRFQVSRAIYKGMLRFLATFDNKPYVVQPLPVSDFKIELTNDNSFKLSWKPVTDPLEETAKPKKYMVYTRINDNGFDEGTLVDSVCFLQFEPDKDKIYSFKVTAVNEGGEGFPSEILAAAISSKNTDEILVVNGFDRLEGPQFIEAGNTAGFMRYLDEGVGYIGDFHVVGEQYDFNRNSAWLDDDSPGFGASFADQETEFQPGNNFDYSYIHGKSILAAGYSFVSISDESFYNLDTSCLNYKLVDFIYGEEKTARSLGKSHHVPDYRIYTPEFIKSLEKLVKKNVPVFISGAYIGTDIPGNDSIQEKIKKLLGFIWRTDHASRLGTTYSTTNKKDLSDIKFVTTHDSQIYKVESPDAVEPANSLGRTVLRYSENNMSAAVFYKGSSKVFSMGFPFECVDNEKNRNILMQQIINLLTKPE